MGERLKKCRIIEIPRFTDRNGSLSVIQGTPFQPFDPKRFYYIYGLAEGARRGGHAHAIEQELIMALAGSFKVLVNDGDSTNEFELNSPDQGLYVPPLVWHELYNFSPGSVCAVVASERYNTQDYYYSDEEFFHALREHAL
jgi:dTDP-4-dehydrorhamnose 3,5-epimerase-like enzyme